MLRDSGETIADDEDLSTPQEKLLGKLVKLKVFVLKYPHLLEMVYDSGLNPSCFVNNP